MLQKPSDMSNYQFLQYLYDRKSELGLTWDDIADIMNEYEEANKTGDAYRKMCNRLRNKDNSQRSFTISNDELINDFDDDDKFSEEFNVKKEIQRLKDERTQLNHIYRQSSREELLRDIARESAEVISKRYPFDNLFKKDIVTTGTKSGILLLSDWHYGAVIDNHWNKYNPELCEERLDCLFSKVVEFIHYYKIKTLYVLNLGDLISGRIHAQLRIENREDAVSQVMHVSELLARFLAELSEEVDIEYYDCLDNHSRIEPDKKQSLRLESLARIITWYLDERCKNLENVNINFNTYSDDIVSFRTYDGWNIVGVHGDLDIQRSVIKNMRGMLIERPDLVCTAHMHHFSSNEENECMLISNPSLMGTDGFAESKRLTSKPAQTLIITSVESPTYAIHRIVLD